MLKKISTALFLSLISISLVAEPLQQEAKAGQIVEQLYHKLQNKPTISMTERIKWFSSVFIDKPYILGALGEGRLGEFDQDPLYRMDGFDCVTLIDTVLALAFAKNLLGFQQCMKNIRYLDGQVSFVTRNHFTSRDWNRNNQKAGYIKDITLSITNQDNQPVALVASTLINKPAWYDHFTDKSIRVQGVSEKEKEKRLLKLRHTGKNFKAIEQTIPYIPLTALFDEKQQPNRHLFKQIPDASIIEIIRPNWDLRSKIGTCLHVSHLGFAIWDKGTLMYREASSTYNRVVDVPLVEYLQKALKSPTIKGINIQIVLPQTPLPNHCRT